jgi:signal transduction histidine kinase
LLESKKSYVRYISHELRTPLNTAFLGLKLLTGDLKESDGAKDAGRYDILCDVNLSCMAAVDILNDLLCYEKLESGILELHKENITVEPFLNECVSMFSSQARESNVSLVVVTDDDAHSKPRATASVLPLTSTPLAFAVPLLPDDTIFADKFKMDQVIRNLISNALKFTAPGGAVTLKASFVYRADAESARSARQAEATVLNVLASDSPARRLSKKHRYFQRSSATVPLESVSCQSNDSYSDPLSGYLAVVVTDTGAGISKQNQIRLFKEIVQFSPEKLQSGGGSGLGLWITSGIMDLHGGRIRVFSEGEGKGSSFTVEIPMIRSHLQPPNSTAAQRTAPVHMMRSPSTFTTGNTSRSGNGNGNGTPDPLTRDREREREREREHEGPKYLKKIPASARGSSSSLVIASVNTGASLFSGLEVLVVDDSRLNRKMLLKCLISRGHVCTEAGDGLEAIEAVKKRIGHTTGCRGKPFDAILMDFVMPNMDGPTATKEIRALGYTAPIFGVTGNGPLYLSSLYSVSSPLYLPSRLPSHAQLLPSSTPPSLPPSSPGLPSDVDYFLGCGADKVLLKPLDFDAFGQAMRDLETEFPERIVGGDGESGTENEFVDAHRCSL